jgi:hypothetical protein
MGDLLERKAGIPKIDHLSAMIEPRQTGQPPLRGHPTFAGGSSGKPRQGPPKEKAHLRSAETGFVLGRQEAA